MRTVHPCIMIGSYGWEQDRVPRDEFQIRMAALNGLMDAKGWKAMLIFGDAREHSDLAFFSNFVPRLRWGMALLPRSGEPRLLVSMSSRDMPAMRLATWIPDVMTGWTWDTSFDPWLARLTSDAPADLGTVRFDLMRPPLMGSLEQSLGNRFRLVAADADVAALRATRPRERSLMCEAASLAQDAGAELLAAWRRGAGIEAAALDAELAARRKGAQDVRTLVSLDGGRTLVPYQGLFEKKAGPLVAYLAVKTMGYWADMFITVDEGRSQALQNTEAALDTLIAAVRPGARAGELYDATINALRPLPLHPALSQSIGHGIGLSLNEQPELRAGNKSELVEDGIYTLQVGVADANAGNALQSAVIRCAANGAEVLVRSPNVFTPA
jgi:Xaa-Pro aminopeptidase